MNKIKKDNLKLTIKPIILECLQELLFEENVLSTIFNEALKVKNQNVLVEQSEPENVKLNEKKFTTITSEKQKNKENSKLKSAKSKIISNPKLNKFKNIFENFTEQDLSEESEIPTQDDGMTDFVNSVVDPKVLKSIIQEEQKRKNVTFSDAPSIKNQIYATKASSSKKDFVEDISTLPDFF